MGVMHKNTPTTGLTAPSLAAETAVYTTPVIQSGAASVLNPVAIAGTYYYTAGTGTVSLSLRLRQGNGVGGPVVQTLPSITVVAGNAYSVSFGFTDSSGFLQSPGQYTLTAQQGSGTANGNSSALDIEVSI